MWDCRQPATIAGHIGLLWARTFFCLCGWPSEQYVRARRREILAPVHVHHDFHEVDVR